jgi:hypothetical protein
MPFRQIWHGSSFDVEARVENDRCAIEDILAGTVQSNPLPGWKRIVSLIIEISENGLPENDELCRVIPDAGEDELYEFRFRGGISVISFFFERTLVICSIALDRTYRQSEIRKALTLRTEYLKEKNSNGKEEGSEN